MAPSIPPQFDIRKLVAAKIDKRGRHLSAFETAAEMKKERAHRVSVLRSLDPNSELADRLDSCTGKDSCGSLACPLCSRRRRVRSSASILKFLAPYPLADLRYLTLINPKDAVAAGQLHRFDPKKVIHRFRRQLERAYKDAALDKSGSFLIGCIDGEWDEGWQLYQPHLHAVTYQVPEAVLSKVVKGWRKEKDRVKNRKRLEPIDDLPRVVTYLDKSFWPCVARKHNRRRIHPHGKRRPPAAIENELLEWLDIHSASDLRMRFGVKLGGIA